MVGGLAVHRDSGKLYLTDLTNRNIDVIDWDRKTRHSILPNTQLVQTPSLIAIGNSRR